MITDDEALDRIHAALQDDGPPDFEEFTEPITAPITGPILWAAIPQEKAADAWAELRGWVEELLDRYSHLDHHVIPLCWWRHNSHVEALAALRDYERVCYSDSSPATAAVEWHRAFRDIEGRLQEWTSALACGAVHDQRARRERIIDHAEWDAFVAADTQRRPETPAEEDEQETSETTEPEAP